MEFGMQISLKEFFILGGWAMWPLLVFSIAAVALILERSFYLLLHRLNVQDLAESILTVLARGDVEEARSLCRQAPPRTPAAKIFLIALESIDLGEHRIERVMEAAAAKEVQALEKGFDLLTAIGSLAPITGFLGTVSGMIRAFQSISQAAEISAQLVAGGIFEALITTAYGLTIAIAAIAGYNIFSHIVDRFAASLEEAGNEILNAILRLGQNNVLPGSEGGVYLAAADYPETVLSRQGECFRPQRERPETGEPS